MSKRILYGFIFQLLFSSIVLASSDSALTFNLSQEEVRVTGKVLDELGLPLPGATISVAGTTQCH